MNIFTLPGRHAFLMAAVLLFLGAAAPPAFQTDPSATPPPAESATVDTSPTATADPSQPTTTPAPSPTPLPPGDIRFGVIESYEDPGAAGRLGAAWTRLRFQWAEVQPDGPTDWEPPLDDEALAAELEAGREVVGLLIGVPSWARDRGGVPLGLSQPAGDPDNLWAVFVGDVVARYAGRIDHWIVWNEPDIDDPDAPGHTWDGTIEEFVQLQRTAYLAAKGANPDAVVHLGAFTYFWDPGYLARFLDLVADDPEAAANDFYFDVATAHLYFQPNSVYNVLHAFRRTLDAHDLRQPIWLVETNAPPMNDPYWVVDNWTLAVDLNEQAAFIPQALAAAMAAGAERIAVYKLKDTAGDRAANPEPFGLIRWDNSRRPAFDTYRVAIRLLGGVTAAERERWDSVGQVRLAQEEQTTTVLFARLPDPQTAYVPATSDTAELVDMWGRRETIEAAGEYFTIELPGALCLQTIADYCMIGGTTYYLIQNDDGRPRPPLVTPTADASPRATARPTRAAQPTRTARSTATPVATATPQDSPTPIVVAALSTPLAPTTQPTATTAAPATTAPAASPGDNQPANYVGLVFMGLGLILGVALVGWQAARRRGK